MVQQQSRESADGSFSSTRATAFSLTVPRVDLTLDLLLNPSSLDPIRHPIPSRLAAAKSMQRPLWESFRFRVFGAKQVHHHFVTWSFEWFSENGLLGDLMIRERASHTKEQLE